MLTNATVTSAVDQTATQKQTYLLTYCVAHYVATGHRGAFRGRNRPGSAPKEDRRTPPKLPKLEHVALNSASETGAKMHQNAQICKLIIKNFPGAMPPDPIPGRGYSAPPQALPPRRSGASRLPRLVGGLWPLHRPPTRNPGSTPGRTHPLKILARLCALTIMP